MPEIAEVEAAARKLDRWTAGRTLSALEILDDKLLAHGEPAAAAGRAVRRARRRAKYIVLELPPLAAVLHLRMTGKLVQGEGARPPRARLRFTEGPPVSFEDMRRFGTLHLLDEGDLEAFFAGKRLGPEPWPPPLDPPRDGAWWAARFAGMRGPVKPALLNQARVAGLGNIAAIELLWRARVRPDRSTAELDAAQWAAVAAACPAHLDLALKDAMQEDFVYLTEARGEASNPFRVYGRAGEACPRCGGEIARFVQSGRSTFWCPGCQG